MGGLRWVVLADHPPFLFLRISRRNAGGIYARWPGPTQSQELAYHTTESRRYVRKNQGLPALHQEKSEW